MNRSGSRTASAGGGLRSNLGRVALWCRVRSAHQRLCYDDGETGRADLTSVTRLRKCIPFGRCLTHINRPGRAGRHTRPAPGACSGIHRRHRHPARLRRKPYRPYLALIAADAAFNPFMRQTLLADRRPRLPRRLPLGPLQRPRLADLDALPAKRTFSRREIHPRIPAVAIIDDPGRTSMHAIPAARACVQEVAFRQRPGRAQRLLARRKSTAQEVAAAGRIGHFAALCCPVDTESIPLRPEKN